MDKKKKTIIISIISGVFAILLIVGIIFLINNNGETKLKELPKPEITGGERGELGIDKNINESTIDEYLNRKDSVYRDMRMLEDPGNYEAIGGDRYLSGYVEGFEVIPLPYIIPVTGLPGEVGDTYTGTTLFYDDNGTYVANYEESMEIIEKIFPKDKVIFLMCGGGGYAGMTKNFLVSLGWDENKIYNTGGYWYYKGKHNIEVKKEVDGVVTYDFESVPYHKIDFNKLTKTEKYREPTIKVSELKINTSKLELEKGTSFKLNVIVLPNDAPNKEVEWSSDNESVATVENGLVSAVGVGTATITVKAKENNKSVTCNVTVKKRESGSQIEIDDLSEEIAKFSSYDLIKLSKDFYELTELKFDEDGNAAPNKYYDFDGVGYQVNDLWHKEYEKYEQKVDQANKNRIAIFNKALDDKKNFIVVIHTKICDDKPYLIAEGAAKILNENNYSYFDVSTIEYNGDTLLNESKLDKSNYNNGSLIIIKEGKIYASINPEKDSIKTDKELKNWLSKYIYLN